jgi:hypothetical protein
MLGLPRSGGGAATECNAPFEPVNAAHSRIQAGARDAIASSNSESFAPSRLPLLSKDGDPNRHVTECYFNAACARKCGSYNLTGLYISYIKSWRRNTLLIFYIFEQNV